MCRRHRRSDGPNPMGDICGFVWVGLGPVQKAGKTVEAKEVYSRIGKAHDGWGKDEGRN